MQLEAIYHRPKLNWSYALDDRTLHIRLRTRRDDVDRVDLFYGDKYGWDKTNSVKPMVKWGSDRLFDYWEAAVQPPYRRLVYFFGLHAGTESVYLLEKGFQTEAPSVSYEGLFDFPFINPADVFKPPVWAKEAIFYQIFPDRFACGDPSINPPAVEPWGGTPTPKNFFGGDLQGVIDHLDYLHDLGINAIYFNPLFEATTNHRYDTKDYLRVDPYLGTNDKLKELVDACHSKGIRVMLDAVFNHCGHTFPPFVDVQEKGEASPYAGWFHVREWPLAVKEDGTTYDTFGFEPIMPKLNTEHPEVKAYLLKVASYWLTEIGIDGWRLDVANEVDHQFWREFRKVVKEANPEAYIVGEIMHDSLPWLLGDQFDAVMNYPFTNILLQFFAHKKTDAGQFADAITTQLANYPKPVNEVAFNLLGSHDTDRLLSLCEGSVERVKLATLFQLTYPGTPCIYYGDEIGMDGNHDPDNRKCMIWDPAQQNQELFSFFRDMIRLRRLSPALRDGSIRFISIADHDHILAYERQADEERYLIVLNNQDQAVIVQVPVTDSQRWQHQTGEQELLEASDEVLHIPLEAYGWAILKAADTHSGKKLVDNIDQPILK
ncbi:alpha-glycosidase [Paenibacillus sambharensis]|uniref:Alpha-glycosidase n=1 Tax=Paenibacillus sambharensis TaxID=1803190 RepID=A0A2W1L3R6_9BACL|nr:alpha-glycosidase [Paenibacillus sambharensis]PZD94648.1 alpha-glycosidase [Paenibacillus sambharensis]